ncbi:hypothetical protein GCM10022223_55780 [Kineosporia mesophila]|uniref:DUF397 domain-containing protein n=1 Tax=Kineosporia mesophila TaxID=566012 RepID=A0ABP7AEG8_9ACTN|nr:DUF397 domain-containing protein [Kineosporia mesophila]MCD5352880.1 DUF397 domain-containing protein [Kineosporia mesophila]
MTSNNTPWIKASASTGDCVEMRRHDGLVEVRDTKDQGAGPVLRSAQGGFAVWLAGA